MKKLIVILCLLIAVPALACEFNTDCEPGSRCIKAPGELEGVCVGGISPGNSNDYRPMRDKPISDLNGTYGNTCEFNTDCGPGAMCYKPNGGLYGTCIKR